MNYYFTTYQISNKNTRLYTRFIAKNIVQINHLHYISYFSNLYRIISIFPLANLVVL